IVLFVTKEVNVIYKNKQLLMV
ncbi:hypothetical protein ACTFIV_003272, partial [Dictyostelium citrinum]